MHLKSLKKYISMLLVFIIAMGIFPPLPLVFGRTDSGLPGLKNNDKVSVSKTLPPGIDKGPQMYSGVWDVKVNGGHAGQSVAIKTLVASTRNADQYNFIDTNNAESWIRVFDGEWDFARSKISDYKTTIKKLPHGPSFSNRIYIGYLAQMAGAYVAKYEVTGEEGISGTVYLGRTRRPAGYISVKPGIKEKETVWINISGTSFVQRSNEFYERRNGSQAKYSLDIDGKRVIDGEEYKGNYFNDNVSYQFKKKGSYVITLYVKDQVGRVTKTEKRIEVESDKKDNKPKPLPVKPGAVTADIKMDFSPWKVREGSAKDVTVKLDASRSRSSGGQGYYDFTWWIKKNGKWVTSSRGESSGSLPKFSIIAIDSCAGDEIWAKVRVYEESLGKYGEAEIIGYIGSKPERDDRDPTPPPIPPQPVNIPPVARIILPSKVHQGDTVGVTNMSYDPDGEIIDAIWDVSPMFGAENIQLGLGDGEITFTETGTYTVYLTVIDDRGAADSTAESVVVENRAPKAVIQCLDEIYQGDEIIVMSNSYDPDGDDISLKWEITPENNINGTLEGEESEISFTEPGEYKVTLKVIDLFGLSDIATKTIKVKPVIPEAYCYYEGTPKENRKIVLDATLSTSHEKFPIDWEKTRWEIIPPVGCSSNDIKIIKSADLKTKTVLFKKAGTYKVRLRVTNTAGHNSEWYEMDLRIHPDEPPIADFYVQTTVARDPENNNKARIELIDASYSPDGDPIVAREWKYKYDSNNNGRFDDEAWKIIDTGNNRNPVIFVDDVGKYLFELEVKEAFGEETIPEFIRPEDYRTADTSKKPMNDKICEVINIQPVVDFDVITKPRVDLVVKGVTNNSWASKFTKEANSFFSNISGKGFNVKHDVKLEQKTIKTRIARKGEIYFRSYRYPFSGWEEYLYSTNYDYKTNIGKFNRTLYYSNNIGNSNFNSLYITVEELQAVPEDQYYPSYEPRVYYSYDGSTWHKVSISYNNRYGDWQSLGTGEYTKRAFEFDSDYIRDDVRYIKVLNHNGYADRDDIVYVDATAYGNEEYTAYANLDDNKFTEELERSWQEDSQKYVIIISDCSDDIGNVYDIINGYITKGVKVVFVGAASLKTLGEQIAQGTGGAYFQFRGSNIPWDEIAKYLEKELLKQKTIAKYVLLNEEVEYKTFYNDTENDSMISDRWIYTHDPHYFENSLGLADFSDKYVSLPIEKFDKVGKYKVIYQVRDNPKNDSKFDNYRLWSHMPLSNLEIYVHRKPIAQFTAPLEKEGSKYKINISSTSYDLDHMSEPNKGIVEEKWQWKEYNSINWNEGKPSFIGQREKMLVSLEVKDLEGAWSDPHVQTISTEAKALPPVAMFTVDPTVQVRYGQMVITDQSYDPGGYEITNREWRVKSPDGTWKNRGNTVPNDIVNMGLGEYEIELKVRNSKRLWSEPYTQTVKIIEENKKPVARFTIGPNPIIADEAYTLKDTSYDPDGDPIVAREWKIQKPNGAWVNISEWKPTFEEMGFDDDGVYKIGLRVKDDPTVRYPILTPLWSDWYYQTVTVESPLKVIGDSDKDIYRAGQAMLLSAETEGKAFKVEAKMWYPKNEFTSTNITTLLADYKLSDPPQKKMTWRTRRTKTEGRDIVVIIPLKTPDGTYPVTFTAYKRKYDGGVKTATHTINVKVKGTVYDHSHSEIIGPLR